jgi:leucyl/phenylalanyl-tRNA--protein transferase
MTRDASPPPEPAPNPFAGLSLVPGKEIVASGGVLAPGLVYDAYREGVFPWYDADQPVLWWCPDPRAILPLEAFHVSRRLARTVADENWVIRRDTAFADVMAACDENRPDGSWIHPAMRVCFEALHARGQAHSVEVWRDEQLVGGLYGVAFGGGFAAESMFHRERDASKVALVALARHLAGCGFSLLDVQFTSAHLAQFGCIEIPRADYLARVHAVRDRDVSFLAR